MTIATSEETGQVKSPVYLSTKMTFSTTIDAIFCRISNQFRMKFITPPGLYALGKPGKESPVLITANYTLSVHSLQSALKERDVWILVIDTKGINVWCAAGKGTFCTKAILKELNDCSLKDVITHRTLILPQLGAPGVNAIRLQRESGFIAKIGPVRASDIPTYLDNNYVATKAMRRVRFSIIDRIKLVPMETIPALKPVLLFLFAAAVLFGITPAGILFKPALTGIFPLAIAGFTAVIAGSILTPVFLPLIPFRAFTLKGVFMGVIGAGVVLYTLPLCRTDLLLTLLCVLAIPAYSSYCAFQFTGSTTYTSPAGVKLELKKAWPLFIASAGMSLLLFLGVLIRFWGLL